ncbi:hypothetical protein IB238_09400 [Rhizobium sp. ARZ01]|uniref:hypothetical protein n=1 Tax=Rhizobium sp. ARZ01 TaxID=2769313 RepID=UPI00177CDC96|nr:hypothetical protein [Rhizobium sp. ARZ01]MBD9372831.1 hypothetical protein [Rhizobium sp. ARZ01]
MKGAAAPTEQMIRACAQDILASRAFSRSGRLRAFLEYVVERELTGKASQLKGYTIGIDVFGRPIGFDAGTDPIVRVQAGKLRKLLKEYYENEGADTPLRIRIPIGSYVPEYERTAPRVCELGRAEVAADFCRRRRKRNGWRRCWRPAPVSSHLAILTLLPLFILLPATYPKTIVTSIANARISLTAAEIDRVSTLPNLRIEPCPKAGGCRDFADAIGKAASYYRTIHLRAETEHDQAGPLSYTIRVETWRGHKDVYARLVHNQSGETVHAQHFRPGDLDDAIGIAYEAVAFTGRTLSANGRLYLHAAQLGAASAMMTCLQEADRQRYAGGAPTPCDQDSTNDIEQVSRVSHLDGAYKRSLPFRVLF